MDPDEALAELERLAAKARGGVHGGDYRPDEYDAIRFCELFEALHGWMMRGGFPPKAWASALAYRLDVMQLEAAGTSKALDAGTWGTAWRVAS